MSATLLNEYGMVWHGCYRLHYPRRSAQCIISVKPARSEVTWQLVTLTLARGLMSEGGDVCDCDFRGSDVRGGQISDQQRLAGEIQRQRRATKEKKKKKKN